MLNFFRLLRSNTLLSEQPFSGYKLSTIVFISSVSLVALPYGNATVLDTLQQILIFTSLALSYDFFSGYAGYYNLGFGAFLAVGAYAFVFSSNGGLNAILAAILAGVCSSVFAGVMSYPLMRLKGAYFAIATLALVLLLNILDVNLYPYTRGISGIHVDVSGPSITTWLYLSSLLLLLTTLSLHYLIGRSFFGLALRSVREDEEVAESLGVHLFRLKQTGMILSGFFAGLSGSLLAIYFGFISSSNVLSLGLGLSPVIAAIVGGSGVFLGPFVGALILQGMNSVFPSLIAAINPSIAIGPLAIIGIVLILVGYFLPGGILRINFFQKYATSRPDERIVPAFKKNYRGRRDN